MKTKFLMTVACVASIVATPSLAQTYDAFLSFNGTQGAGNFIYGQANPAMPNTSGTFFAATTNCFIDGSICLQESANHDVPGVTKSTSTSFQYGSVNVPDDRLLAHPANNADQTFIAFVAPTAGTYVFDATFDVLDINPTGVGINLIQTTNGGLPLIFTPLAQIGAEFPMYHYTGSFTLGEGYAAGFGLDNAGNYFNDSTGVRFSVAAVPEPATWGLMIAGFGVVGAALRRRRPVLAVA